MRAMAEEHDATSLVRHEGCPIWCGGHAVGERSGVEHYGVVGELCLPAHLDLGRALGSYVVANTRSGADTGVTASVSVLAPAAEVCLSSSEARALGELLVRAADRVDSEKQTSSSRPG
jgi:hypothetical protein